MAKKLKVGVAPQGSDEWLIFLLVVLALVILALSSSTADASFLNVHRFIRSSAINGRREHPTSYIGGRDNPAITKAGRGASRSRA